MRTVRFRTLGCYPLTGAIESDGRRRCPAIIRRCCSATTSERQGRVIDHDSAGARWRRRSRKATSDGDRWPSRRTAPARYRRASERREPAALHHLRHRSTTARSTLIGRLLYESQDCSSRTSWPRSRPTRSRSARRAATSTSPSLVDGLTAGARARASPSTSPTASSPPSARKFIVADTPGHEQYTRNMVTGASTGGPRASSSIDARKGVLTQTRRHSYLVSLLGIRHVVLAVNKMDLVGYSRATASSAIDADYRRFAARVGLDRHHGHSDVRRSTATTSSSTSATHALVRGPDARCTTWRPSRSMTAGGDPPVPRCPVQLVNQPHSNSAASPAPSRAAPFAR